MSLDSVVNRFRHRQADLFRDEADVSRLAAQGSGTISSSGEYTPSTAVAVYSGACLVRAFQWEGTDITVGGTEVRLRRARIKFPVDTDIQHDDIIVPSASTFDESMIGVAFRVTDTFKDGWQISRVCIAEEVTEP